MSGYLRATIVEFLAMALCSQSSAQNSKWEHLGIGGGCPVHSSTRHSLPLGILIPQGRGWGPRVSGLLIDKATMPVVGHYCGPAPALLPRTRGNLRDMLPAFLMHWGAARPMSRQHARPTGTECQTEFACLTANKW